MIIKNIFNLLYSPKEEWHCIAKTNRKSSKIFIFFVIPMALIPTISATIGASYVGWNIAGGEIHKLTFESAVQLSIAAFFGMLMAVAVGGWLIQWMAKTYGGNADLSRSMALAAYSATPLFLVGVLGLYPVLWVDMLFTLIAIALSVRLLFLGVPVMMETDEDKGFLYANSILTVAMVLVIGLLVITVLFWGSGLAPAFMS